MSEDYDIVEHVKWAAEGWRRDDALRSRDPETEAAFCDNIACEITRLRGEVEGLTALASREGWVMVPVKPTEAMIDNAVGTLTVLNGSEWELARQFYAAMISSAPKPEG